MKQRHLKEIIFMLLIIISVISIYGCGRKSKGIENEKTIVLAYDTDQDGTPDVFDDYPDNADKSDHPVVDEADHSTTHDSIETAIGKDTPFHVPSTFKGTIDPANSQDYFAVSLEAGKTYSLVFYNPQKMDGRAVTFVPNVSVYTGNVSYRTEVPDPVDGEVLPGTIQVIDDYEELLLESSLAGESRIVILSFTPQESRIHYIAINSAQVVDEEEAPYQYRFDLIEDHDKDGMRIQFKVADGGNYIYSHNDILLLKDSMIRYVSEWADDGSPMLFSDEAQTEFSETVNYLAAARAKPECRDQTSLKSYVSHIPWDDSYLLGYGMDASTGLPADRLKAVTPFAPANPIPSTETDTFVKFINSDSEYEKEVQMGFSTSFSAYGVTAKASSSYLNNVKYSEKETTLILKYFVKETAPRLLELTDYTLTEDAKTYLNDHKDDFRNRYGDYFIAGATYGAQYIATLHIKAKSSEKIEKIEAALAISGFNASGAAEFKQKFSEATKDSEVTVERTTIGGEETKLSAGITPEQMFDDLEAFIQSVNIDNRAPLESYMLRFNQIPDGYSIASEINVNSCTFSATRELSKNYLALSKRAQIIAGLDANTFQAGVQNDYTQEYDTLINEINDNKQAIFKDINKIETYGTEVKATLNKFSDLIDRQSFFMKLVQLQSKWAYHTEHRNRESGFKTYCLSRTVDNDLSKPSKEDLYKDSHSEAWHIGYRYWRPSWKPGDDSIVCYIKIGVNSSTSGDDCWDTNHPSLGRDALSFTFKSGYDRMGSWKLWAKGVYLGENGKSATGNYPFNWDKMK